MTTLRSNLRVFAVLLPSIFGTATWLTGGPRGRTLAPRFGPRKSADLGHHGR